MVQGVDELAVGGLPGIEDARGRGRAFDHPRGGVPTRRGKGYATAP